MRKDRTSTGALRADLTNLEKTGEFIAAEARKLRKEIEEAHDAGLLALRSSTGGSLPPKGSVSSSTENSAASVEFRRLQVARRKVADRLSRSKTGASAALAHLEAAGEELFGAWLRTDAEIAAQIREREEARPEPELPPVEIPRCPMCGSRMPEALARRFGIAKSNGGMYPSDQQNHRPPSENGQGIALGGPTSASPS